MPFDKLTWVGLMLVALGWALLFSGAPLADLFARVTGRVIAFGSPSDMLGISQCAILSGFGLAVLGVLQTGFGALNRFFEAVLERTAKPQNAEPMQVSVRRSEPQNKAVLERGRLKDRAYVRFVDGSVEVETLLGLRHFPNLDEALEFIG
jgi:hypothetical protein